MSTTVRPAGSRGSAQRDERRAPCWPPALDHALRMAKASRLRWFDESGARLAAPAESLEQRAHSGRRRREAKR
jgi:hypothetical protein